MLGTSFSADPATGAPSLGSFLVPGMGASPHAIKNFELMKYIAEEYLAWNTEFIQLLVWVSNIITERRRACNVNTREFCSGQELAMQD